ncbi:MAG: hypothetical protein IJB67_07745 [Firmicutes bacterium]|nr:hypothetical protein [Bacillota bacterium]
MQVRLIIKCRDEWLEPPLLDEPRLLRAANAAAVLEAAVVKNGALDFAEGAAVRLLADGKEIFRGRVFEKQRTRPEVIKIVAYDELRYWQNRDCCIFEEFMPSEMVRRIAAILNLPVGEAADCGMMLAARAYDNRRYLDMMSDVLDEVLKAKGKHYFLLAEGGKIYLRDCEDMQVDLLLDLTTIGGYEYRTSIDRGYANRVKVIYEDKRKALRRQFVAENRQEIERVGVLQYVSKSAAADKQTAETARQLLRELNRRTDSLSVSDVPGDVRVRGGSLVWLRMDLGDRVVDCRALVQKAVHRFVGGECLMDLELAAEWLV